MQALECDLLNEFLSILDSPLQEVESPAGCKALIVKAVKAMQCSLLYGEQISTILKDSQVSVKFYENSEENYYINTTENKLYCLCNQNIIIHRCGNNMLSKSMTYFSLTEQTLVG